MTLTRPAPGDPGNDGSATDATVVIGALVDEIGVLSRGYRQRPSTMASPPTLTVSASGAATAISGGTITAPNSDVFTYRGAAYTNVGTLGSFGNCYRQTSATDSSNGTWKQYRLCVEFETDADDFEIVLRSESALTTSITNRYRVWVDGQPAAAHAQYSAASGEYRRIRVQFGSVQNRRIMVEATGSTFCGVTKAPKHSLWASLRDQGPVCVALTDSYGYALDVTVDVFWPWDSYGVVAGRYFGWDVHPAAVGGTGFVADYSGTQPNYVTRLTSDVIDLAPDIVLVAGSINEYSTSVATNAATVFNNLRAALPDARIIGFSGVCPTWTYTAGMLSNAAHIETAVLAVDGEYIEGAEWIGGTGSYASPTGDGNADIYHDGYSHLKPAGYAYVADRLAAHLSPLMTRTTGF